jgi:hypothetical protein
VAHRVQSDTSKLTRGAVDVAIVAPMCLTTLVSRLTTCTVSSRLQPMTFASFRFPMQDRARPRAIYGARAQSMTSGRRRQCNLFDLCAIRHGLSHRGGGSPTSRCTLSYSHIGQRPGTARACVSHSWSLSQSHHRQGVTSTTVWARPSRTGSRISRTKHRVVHIRK